MDTWTLICTEHPGSQSQLLPPGKGTGRLGQWWGQIHTSVPFKSMNV